VTHFLNQYGLIVVFVVVFLETMGIPLPGETALIAAAILAAQGHFSITSVIVVGATAAILGDNTGYWLGRELGRGFLQRYGVVRRFSDRVIPPAERFFEKHGGKAIFLARWFSGFRVAGAWIAGFSRMPWWRFFIWNASGGIVWAVTVSLVAYYAGEAAANAIGHYGLIGAGVVVILVALILAGMYLWRRRMMDES
jgi:membrane protein DedA with SNARE-associated domain